MLSCLARVRRVCAISYGCMGRSYKQASTASASGLLRERETMKSRIYDFEYFARNIWERLSRRVPASLGHQARRPRPGPGQAHLITGVQEGGAHDLFDPGVAHEVQAQSPDDVGPRLDEQGGDARGLELGSLGFDLA